MGLPWPSPIPDKIRVTLEKHKVFKKLKASLKRKKQQENKLHVSF